MNAWFGRFAMAVALLGAAPAFGGTLGGDIKSLAARFNETAKSLNLPTRMAFSKCESEVAMACTFVVSKSLRAVGSSRDKKGLDSLMFFFGGQHPKLNDLMGTMVVLMAMYAPEASVDERGVIMRELIEGLALGVSHDATLHGLKLTLSASQLIGVTLHISR